MFERNKLFFIILFLILLISTAYASNEYLFVSAVEATAEPDPARIFCYDEATERLSLLKVIGTGMNIQWVEADPEFRKVYIHLWDLKTEAKLVAGENRLKNETREQRKKRKRDYIYVLDPVRLVAQKEKGDDNYQPIPSHGLYLLRSKGKAFFLPRQTGMVIKRLDDESTMTLSSINWKDFRFFGVPAEEREAQVSSLVFDIRDSDGAILYRMFDYKGNDMKRISILTGLRLDDKAFSFYKERTKDWSRKSTFLEASTEKALVLSVSGASKGVLRLMLDKTKDTWTTLPTPNGVSGNVFGDWMVFRELKPDPVRGAIPTGNIFLMNLFTKQTLDLQGKPRSDVIGFENNQIIVREPNEQYEGEIYVYDYDGQKATNKRLLVKDKQLRNALYAFNKATLRK